MDQAIFLLKNLNCLCSLKLQIKVIIPNYKIFQEFRHIIDKLRSKNHDFGCMPYNFNVMLEHLSEKVDRKQLNDDIDDFGLTSSNIENTLEKFSELFENGYESLEKGIF